MYNEVFQKRLNDLVVRQSSRKWLGTVVAAAVVAMSSLAVLVAYYPVGFKLSAYGLSIDAEEKVQIITDHDLDKLIIIAARTLSSHRNEDVGPITVMLEVEKRVGKEIKNFTASDRRLAVHHLINMIPFVVRGELARRFK